MERREGRLNNKLKMKALMVLFCSLIFITGDFFVNYEEKPVPFNSLLYISNYDSPSIFAEVVQDIKFLTAIDSIYESKEYSDYIYTQSDLLMAKEYRLYTTDKDKLFENIYEGENFEKSILILLKNKSGEKCNMKKKSLIFNKFYCFLYLVNLLPGKSLSASQPPSGNYHLEYRYEFINSMKHPIDKVIIKGLLLLRHLSIIL